MNMKEQAGNDYVTHLNIRNNFYFPNIRQSSQCYCFPQLVDFGTRRTAYPPSSCVTFDSEERVITITCRNINLTEINTVLKDPDVLRRDEAVENGWILNAGIIVAADSLLYINSTDTSWLKIIPDEETSIANGLQVHGNLKIDSVKISSWDPEIDDYVMFEVLHKPREEGTKTDYDTVARPYIRIAVTQQEPPISQTQSLPI